ncbi:unnamed protein product [Miscanthus lutarioriparius]|uniref:Uncharacterized protein n=1 Tax=Miscanthus lutarioriparius TaxID=422564 RepID=A0A811QV36_9POAL|nr:unnamed protein product [Miscanthus lutarioriparius]
METNETYAEAQTNSPKAKAKGNHLPKSAVLAEEKHHELEGFQAETQLKTGQLYAAIERHDYEDRTGNGGRDTGGGEFRAGQPRDAEKRQRGEGILQANTSSSI